MSSSRAALCALAAAGGPLEVRDDLAPMRARVGAQVSAHPGPDSDAIATVMDRLLPIEAHILGWLFEQRVEIAPGDYSWQDAPREGLRLWFGLDEAHLALLEDDLSTMGLLERRGSIGGRPSAQDTVGLSATGIRFLRVSVGEPAG